MPLGVTGPGLVLGEANGNGLKDLRWGVPQHLSFHLKAEKRGGLGDLGQGTLHPGLWFSSSQ